MTADNRGITTNEIIVNGLIRGETAEIRQHYLELYSDQLRRETVEEQFNKDTETMEYNMRSAIQEAKKELLDENKKLLSKIFALEANFDHTKIPNCQHCPHCDIMMLIQRADYSIKENFELERAKTLGDIRSIAPLDSQPEGFESNVKK